MEKGIGMGEVIGNFWVFEDIYVIWGEIFLVIMECCC